MLSKEKKNRIFNLEPEQFSPEVNVKHYKVMSLTQPTYTSLAVIPVTGPEGR